MDPIVSQGWLAEHLADPGVRAVDCRFVLGQPGAGRQRYLAGHVAGAAFLDLDADLSGSVGDGRDGRPDARSRAARSRSGPTPRRLARSTVWAPGDGLRAVPVTGTVASDPCHQRIGACQQLGIADITGEVGGVGGEIAQPEP